MSTDMEWERWGKEDPYYGVITKEKFRSKNLTPEVKHDFFESGYEHIARILRGCREHIDGDFAPKKALDFGCGTGRLVIPLARIAESVVGIDVSESMLKECRKNCDEQHLTNVTLVKSDDDLSGVEGKYDLIHSYIVFQHIPVYRGLHILAKLVEHLEVGGIGAIQILYAKTVTAKELFLPPPPPPSDTVVIWHAVKNILRPIKRMIIKPPAPPPSDELREPEIQMNPYNVNALLYLIQSLGTKKIYIELTNHGGEMGVLCYFQKPKA